MEFKRECNTGLISRYIAVMEVLMVLVLTFKIVRWFVVEIWQKVALEGSLTSWWTDKGFSSTNKQSWKLLTFDNFCQQKTKTVQRTLPVFFIIINETKILFNTLSQPAPLVISSSETKRSNWKMANLSVCNSKTHF